MEQTPPVLHESLINRCRFFMLMILLFFVVCRLYMWPLFLWLAKVLDDFWSVYWTGSSWSLKSKIINRTSPMILEFLYWEFLLVRFVVHRKHFRLWSAFEIDMNSIDFWLRNREWLRNMQMGENALRCKIGPGEPRTSNKPGSSVGSVFSGVSMNSSNTLEGWTGCSSTGGWESRLKAARIDFEDPIQEIADLWTMFEPTPGLPCSLRCLGLKEESWMDGKKETHWCFSCRRCCTIMLVFCRAWLQ